MFKTKVDDAGRSLVSISLICSKLLRVNNALQFISHAFNDGACGPVDNCLILALHLARIAYNISSLKIRRRD